MKTILCGIFFMIASLLAAAFLTVILPGKTGLYIGIGLTSSTLTALFLPKKNGNNSRS